MKILGETQRILRFLGLLHDPNTSFAKSLSHKIVVFIFVALMPMSTSSYLLFGSMNSNEFYECAYVFVNSFTVTGCFAVLWWDERRITLFINELESAVTKSEIFLFFKRIFSLFVLNFPLSHFQEWIYLSLNRFTTKSFRNSRNAWRRCQQWCYMDLCHFWPSSA